LHRYNYSPENGEIGEVVGYTSFSNCENVVIVQIQGSNFYLGFEHPEKGRSIRIATEEDIQNYSNDPKIFIKDNKVYFTSTGIKVGCTEVDKETILKIAKRFEP
jgi:hypothetical protein